MTLADLMSALLGPLGLLVGALVLLFAGYREWIIPGVVFRRALARIDKLEADKAKLIEDKDRMAEAFTAMSVSNKILAQLQAEKQASQGSSQGPSPGTVQGAARG